MKSDLFNTIKKRIEKTELKNTYSPLIKHVVAVSGAAALGKTTFCKHLAEFFQGKGYTVSHIELDGYLKSRAERQEEKKSGYDPRSTKFEMLCDNMTRILKQGKAVKIPYYSHSKGNITKVINTLPKQVIILDGIVALHYEVRSLFPAFNIFIEADEITTKGLRIDVDLKERGYNIFQSLSHIDSESREYDRWIHHHSEFADIIIGVNSDRHLHIKYDENGSY